MIDLKLIGMFLGLAFGASQRGFASHYRQPLVASESRVDLQAANLHSLDLGTSQLMAISVHLKDSNQCIPVQVGGEQGYGIFYQYCTEKALANEETDIAIDTALPIPASLWRRVRFWQRIFALWDRDQIIVHSSEYPEVVLEIIDISSHIDDLENPVGPGIKRFIAGQINKYQDLLYGMHLVGDPTSFSRSMLRVAQQMNHIEDPSKYLKAARSLRSQRGQRDVLKKGILAAKAYLPLLHKVFLETGVPAELLYLSFIESGFNLEAQSKVGARGIFQLMTDTAKEYIKVTDHIDERLDPGKSAYAAAQLLKSNFESTQSWPLAVTAYNNGLRRMMQAKEQFATDDIALIINQFKAPRFGFASRNFYLEFIAMLSIIQSEQIYFPDLTKSSDQLGSADE